MNQNVQNPMYPQQPIQQQYVPQQPMYPQQQPVQQQYAPQQPTQPYTGANVWDDDLVDIQKDAKQQDALQFGYSRDDDDPRILSIDYKHDPRFGYETANIKLRFISHKPIDGRQTPRMIRILKHNDKVTRNWSVCQQTFGTTDASGRTVSHKCPFCDGRKALRDIAKKYNKDKAFDDKFSYTDQKTYVNVIVLENANNPSMVGRVYILKMGREIHNVVNRALNGLDISGAKVSAGVNIFNSMTGADFNLVAKKNKTLNGSAVPTYGDSFFDVPSPLFGGDVNAIAPYFTQYAYDLGELYESQRSNVKSEADMIESFNKLRNIAIQSGIVPQDEAYSISIGGQQQPMGAYPQQPAGMNFMSQPQQPTGMNFMAPNMMAPQTSQQPMGGAPYNPITPTATPFGAPAPMVPPVTPFGAPAPDVVQSHFQDAGNQFNAQNPQVQQPVFPAPVAPVAPMAPVAQQTYQAPIAPAVNQPSVDGTAAFQTTQADLDFLNNVGV